jgi:tellurite methyltransferase
MQRKMVGFHQDAESYWVAELDCGHTQHVRHQPPFTLRPWVVTAEGRAARLGQTLDCVLCDRREMPAGHAPYKRTASFRRESIPAGLLGRHSTKPGVWAIIHVVSGELEYFDLGEPSESGRVVQAGEQVLVPSERVHRVAAPAEVEFYVEFWRADAGPAR